MRRIGLLIATSGGLGHVGVAPGTFGAAVGVAWHLWFRQFGAPVEIAALVALTALGIWAAEVTADAAGRKDPSHVVIDEVVGQALTLALLGAGPAGLVAGFALFRFFDIVKPWPVRQFERLPGGLGIMADDLMAGVYGWAVLKGLMLWHPEVF